jgi:hypothetical protein
MHATVAERVAIAPGAGKNLGKQLARVKGA